MFKKVYATISEKDFNEFREKCYSNMKKMGEVFSQLIRDYIEINTEIHKVEHHKSTGADYTGTKK